MKRSGEWPILAPGSVVWQRPLTASLTWFSSPSLVRVPF